jgi:hypothetical protein
MSYDSSTDLQQAQSDILTEDTSTNSLMPYNSLGFLNKALSTDSTTVVGAINDMFTTIADILNNFVSFGNKYNGLLMDIDDSAGQAKLQEMQTLLGYNTVLEAIVELAKRNNGNNASGLISNFSLDDTTDVLSLTLSDGTIYPIDLSPLLNIKANETDLEWGEF